MAKNVDIKDTIVQIYKQMKKLMFVIYQLNFLPQELTRLLGSENIEIIRVSSTYILNHITSLIVEHCSSINTSIRELRIFYLKKFDSVIL